MSLLLGRPRSTLGEALQRSCSDVLFLYLSGYHDVARFEFDPTKSAANLAKHGIDFEHAQSLWEDEDHLEISARTLDEPRWVVLGLLDGRVWAAIVTRRGQAIRIISVRRARPAEEALYEGA